MRHNKLYIVLLLAILSALVRIYHIESQSLWYDENITVLVARLPLIDGLQFLITDGVHPPFFFLIQKLASQIGESHLLVRLPALIFGVLSVVILYLVAEKWAGRMNAFFASLILAVSPFHVWYSQEARMYTFLTFFSLVCMAAYIKFLHKPRIWGNVLFVLSSSLAYLTHYFVLFLPLIHFIHILLNFRRYYYRLRTWTALQFLASLPLLIWIYFLWQRPFHQFSIGWIPEPGLVDLAYTLANFTIGFFEPFSFFHWLIVIGFLGLVLLGVFRPWSDSSFRWLLVLWAFLPPLVAFLFSFARPVYVDRYLILSLPPLLILIASGLTAIKSSWLYVLAGLFLLVISWRTIEMLVSPKELQKENWRQTAEYLNENVLEDEVVIFRTIQVSLPFQYYTLGSTPFKIMQVDQDIWSLEELTVGYRAAWLIYWNATTHAHALGSKSEFDPQEETNPQAAAWINGHGPELLSTWDVPGLTIFHFKLQE